MTIEFQHFQNGDKSPSFVGKIIEVFREKESAICGTSLKSDAVLTELAANLALLGFGVEAGKKAGQTIRRAIYTDQNGTPVLRCNIDAYHSKWRCLLEIEAGRGWKSNAVHRNLIQAMVMDDVKHVIIAVRNSYKYNGKNNSKVESKDYIKMTYLAHALYSNVNFKVPFGLTVIGY